jgi:hypothetical protein
MGPRPGTNSIIAKGEVGLQTNSRFPMQAWGMAAELGYTFAEKKLSPIFQLQVFSTYRG